MCSGALPCQSVCTATDPRTPMPPGTEGSSWECPGLALNLLRADKRNQETYDRLSFVSSLACQGAAGKPGRSVG
ncbi:hypothetical protein NDU88_006602 [Pleurodeles waltl]|uniref:Uncharacterized protein n=1 Tax=Pleurodeles waltl TaxID=8319 RepID=A0AAV7SQC4_PLEWA|nr:hypothetical protein NDU88_006602 [Pleurodeles waltl]